MAQISWTGSNTGTSDWDQASNWTPTGTTIHVLPGPADNVVFVKAGTYSVQILASDPAYTINSLVVRGHATSQIISLLDYGSLTSSTTLAIINGVVDVEAGGMLSATGLTTLDANSNLIVAGMATLNGGISGALGAKIAVTGGHLIVASASTDSSAYRLSGAGTLDFKSTLSSADQVAFTDGSASTLRLDGLATIDAARITGFGADNRIDITSLGFNGGFTYSYTGVGLTLTNTAFPAETFHFNSIDDAGNLLILNDGAGGTLIELACFAEGTRLRTQRGEIAVEDLAIDDRVSVLAAPGAGDAIEQSRIAWIGSRRIDIAAHQRPDLVAPVRVARDAIAPGVPARDVRLSPDHALLLDGSLIPVRMLINGATIAIDHDARRVRYFHVELDRHAAVLADGLPAESYLDTGNRSQFAARGSVRALHPVFEPAAQTTHAAYAERGCAPLQTGADHVRPVWARLRDRAAALGWTVATPANRAPAALTLIAHGRVIRPLVENAPELVFALPAGTRSVRLCSAASCPATAAAWLDDRRLLGVSVERLVLSGDAGRCAIQLDDQGLSAGWHAIEREHGRTWRWTDGSATLSHPALAGARLLTVGVTCAAGAEQRRAA